MTKELKKSKNKTVSKNKDGSFQIHMNEEQLLQMFGTTDSNFIAELITSTLSFKQLQDKDIDVSDIASAHNLYKNLKANDEVDCLLIREIINSSKLAHTFFKKASNPDANYFSHTENTQRYTKCINTMCKLVDSYTKYKRGGAQKVVVEHVTVESGSQAIIGSLEQHK